MKIVVCIKQVPDTTKVDIDEKTGVLKREGSETKMNPYDLYALETALRLREEYGGEITALTMGPPQAETILQEAYMMGVDSCVLLTDRAFAGADVLATSYALAGAIQKIGTVDLVICGKQTTDGDTAQVGAEVAEFLDVPHVANVDEIISCENAVIRVTTELAESRQTLDVSFPCLLTVEKDIHIPRLPSYRKKLDCQSRPVKTIGLNDLRDNDPTHYGLNGSPTQVQKIYTPEATGEKINVTGSGDEIAVYLYQKLKELKFI